MLTSDAITATRETAYRFLKSADLALRCARVCEIRSRTMATSDAVEERTLAMEHLGAARHHADDAALLDPELHAAAARVLVEAQSILHMLDAAEERLRSMVEWH